MEGPTLQGNCLAARTPSLLQRHQRKLVFGGVGVFVMAVGYGLLIGLVRLGMPTGWAYAIQALVSIELNFVLNRRFTWNDREDVKLWSSLLRFHLSRIVTVPMNQVLFNALTWAGVPYYLASPICVAVTTVVNYVAGDRLVFARVATLTPSATVLPVPTPAPLLVGS